MGTRILRISAEILVQLLQGLSVEEGQRFAFRVGNPLPADAKIVSVRYSLYYTDTVDVTLESSEWDTAMDGTVVIPILSRELV